MKEKRVEDGRMLLVSLPRGNECQGHSHPKLSVVQGAGSRLSADKIQPTACRYPTTENTPVWFPGH